jgi:transcriptional regulator with XRE-family HTH domain
MKSAQAEKYIPPELVSPRGAEASVTRTNVGAEVNRLRTAAKVPISKLARKLDVDNSTLSRFFNGDSHPSTNTVKALLGEIGVPPDVVDALLARYMEERALVQKRGRDRARETLEKRQL